MPPLNGSHRKRKAAKNVAKTHLKIDRQRRDHHFKAAKPYADGFRRIVVEDLQITNLVKNTICPFCGYIADRDVNAAQNILKCARPGHGLQELTYTDGCRVS